MLTTVTSASYYFVTWKSSCMLKEKQKRKTFHSSSWGAHLPQKLWFLINNTYNIWYKDTLHKRNNQDVGILTFSLESG